MGGPAATAKSLTGGAPRPLTSGAEPAAVHGLSCVSGYKSYQRGMHGHYSPASYSIRYLHYKMGRER